MAILELKGDQLVCDGTTVWEGLPAGTLLTESHVLRFTGNGSASRLVVSAGKIPGLIRFTCSHRYEPFWMEPSAGTSVAEVPIETQYLLGQLGNGTYLLVVPMVKNRVRCSVQGTADGVLEVVAETGEDALTIGDFDGLFVAVGENPYELITESAAKFAKLLGSMRLRIEKDSPAFTDRFGWCTWDAFYDKVTPELVQQGLESFRQGKVEPKYLILDDGWQSVNVDADGKTKRLTAFEPNEKFPGGLAPMVQMAKGEYGIQEVIAWHAMTGYWGGVDPSFAGYEINVLPRKSSPGIYSYVKEMPWWGTDIGLVSSKDIYRFFQDYHRYLRSQGIDGVKVDVQAQLEIVSEGQGGRVDLMQKYHEALEGSIQVHFQGNLINCMSLSNEMLYSTLASNLTRSFTDFWPEKPASHGLHLYANAQNSVWFGEFIHPDWDMFQSGHAAGAYHAAGRAVSGGPVYVSDKPDGHDFDLLRKLVLPNGDVLRAITPGRPTRDCLLHDTTKEDVLLKIFALNEVGGVVGAFNARFAVLEDGKPDPDHTITVSGSVSPADVEGLKGDEFAVYRHSTQELRVLQPDEEWEVELTQLGWDIFTIVPIEEGFAPIGLVDMLNPGGALSDSFTDSVLLSFGGKFLCYREDKPDAAWVDDKQVPFKYNAKTCILTVDLPAEPEVMVTFE